MAKIKSILRVGRLTALAAALFSFIVAIISTAGGAGYLFRIRATTEISAPEFEQQVFGPEFYSMLSRYCTGQTGGPYKCTTTIKPVYFLRDLFGNVPLVTLVNEPPVIIPAFIILACPFQFIFFITFVLVRIRTAREKEEDQKVFTRRTFQRFMVVCGFISLTFSLAGWVSLLSWWTKVARDYNRAIPVLISRPRASFNYQDLDRKAETGFMGFFLPILALSIHGILWAISMNGFPDKERFKMDPLLKIRFDKLWKMAEDWRKALFEREKQFYDMPFAGIPGV